MEFLKGFSFDLQRHTDYTGAACSTIDVTSADYTGSFWVLGNGTVVATKPTAPATVSAYYDQTATTLYIYPGSTAKIGNDVTKVEAATTFVDTPAATAGTGTLTLIYGTTQFSVTTTTATDFTLTNGALTAATTLNNISNITVSSGTFSTNQDKAVNLSATGSVTYTGATTKANAIVTLSTGKTVALTSTAVNTTVASNGNVTGLAATGVVDTDAAISITSVGAAGLFTINGDAITSTGTNTLVFTSVADTTGGVSGVTGLSSGGTLAWAGRPANGTVTVNNARYDAVNAITVTGTASSSTLTTGSVTISNTGQSSVVTTYQDTSVSVVGGSAVVVTTMTAGVPAVPAVPTVNSLTAGASLSAAKDGIVVGTDTLTTESGSVTVNGKVFTQGFTTGAYAADAMSIRTTTNGAELTAGSAYLSGSATVTVRNGAGAQTSTITVTNGDITVTNSNTGTYSIGDLDNGDSFTVTNSGGSGKITYTVSNGKLVDSNGTITAKLFDASDANYGQVATITNATIGTAFAADAGLAGTGSNLNTSHGTLAASPDVTGRNLQVASVVSGAASFTIDEYSNGSYVHNNGLINSDSTGTIGTVNSTSETFSYTATSTVGQLIDLQTGNETGKWVITGSAGADVIRGNGTESTLDGGAGNDVITARTGDVALGGEGNDELTAAANNVTLSGGAGADTLTAVSSAVGTTTLTGGDGADVFVIDDGTDRAAVITDFDFANDVLYDDQVAASSNFASITSAQVNADGGINLSGGTATVNATNGAYFAQVRGNDRRKQAIGWVGEAATAIDASSMTSSAVIIGNTNTEGDSLYGGSASDTLYGGAGDTVWGGAGRNFVTLSGAASDAKHVLGFGVDNASAHDVVSGFATGFEAEDSDKLILVGGVTTVSTSLTGSGAAGQLTIKSGSSDLIMRNVNVNGTTGAAEVRVGDSKVAFVASGSTATVSSASYADMYFGTKNGSVKSGLSFANIEDSLEVNLSDSKYTNIASVTGGTGNTSLLGGADAETLISAGGNTSLYGGAGKDVLVGRTTAADTFFALDGIGSDTVSGFEGYTENTAETADTVYLSGVSAAKLGSNGITLNLNDSDKVVLTGTGINANTEVRFTTDGTTFGIAKIGSVAGGNNFTYAKEVTYYGGGNGNDTLTFSSGDSDDHQVWLDGSKGVSYSKVNIINGASASGSLELAGDSAKNTITGGSGDDSLWGGSGNTADRLVGNSGANTFFYGLGEGKDTLVSSSADDTVNLYNINLSDVMSGEITNAGVTVNMNDGSTLTVATSRDIKFNLASGESYIANHSTKQWDNA